MAVIAVAAAFVILLALIEIPIGHRVRRWRRRRELHRASGRPARDL
jgi:hypothetical protein